MLVLCEVLNADGTPHATNTRRPIANILSPQILAEEVLFGFEQEWTMFSRKGSIYGWPEAGYPHPQVGRAGRGGLVFGVGGWVERRWVGLGEREWGSGPVFEADFRGEGYAFHPGKCYVLILSECMWGWGLNIINLERC